MTTDIDIQPFELSDRQREIGRLLADGHDSEAIAERLGLSAHTVRTHVKNAMRRNALKTRTQLAVLVERESYTELIDAVRDILDETGEPLEAWERVDSALATVVRRSGDANDR